MVKKYFQNHVRWNSEHSENGELYHFVVLGEKGYRDSRLNKIYENLNDVGGGIIEVRSPSEKITKNGRRYVFTSLESRTSPKFLGLEDIEPDKERRIKDDRLKEKHSKGYSVEDYVSDTYNSRS